MNTPSQESTTEWIASESIADDPEMNAATNLTMQTAMLPIMPATTAIFPRLRVETEHSSLARLFSSSIDGPEYM